jgi:hypothetical protein
VAPLVSTVTSLPQPANTIAAVATKLKLFNMP